MELGNRNIEYRVVTDLKWEMFSPNFINFAINVKLVTRKNSLSPLLQKSTKEPLKAVYS